MFGGGSPDPHPEGEVWGGGSPGPGLGGVSQHALRQTPPPSRRLLLRAVRILLNAFLLKTIFVVAAINLVRDGMSVNKAAENCSVPKSTLARHWQKTMQDGRWKNTLLAISLIPLLSSCSY